MEQVKRRYMKKFVQRSGNCSLKDSIIDYVKKWEAKIRDCYSERIKMDSNEFVLMILVDSCFILQFLILVNNRGDNDDHSLYLEHKTEKDISLDLILLENQVPFFVLEGLFSLATSEACSILRLALQFFKAHKNHKCEHNFESIKHFTHLVLILYQPLPQAPSPSQERFQSLHSSTNLSEAGVRFRVKDPKLCEGLFDITFTNGVLEIPRFVLDDFTEIKIRNLMALEQLCEYSDHKFVTDYFVFMDLLISTTRDVDLLVDKKIIINNLGSNKAAVSLINKLCINVSINGYDFYFTQVCKQLNIYYETPTHRLKAMLKRDYFRTPWKTASTIAAMTLLVLTFIQTVCSIISAVYGS